jgi:hypothetical protein
MNTLLKIFSVSMCVSLWLFTGCSSNDFPEPDNCDGTLGLTLIDSEPVTNCNDTDGRIEVLAEGGTEPYAYQLDNGSFQSSEIFDGNVGPGSHIVTVQDAEDCVFNLDVEIGILNSTLTADKDEEDDTECLTSNGSVTITASGGTAPYDFTLSSTTLSTNPSTFSGLAPGVYSVIVEDAAGCEFPVTATVDQGDTGIDYDNDILPIFQAKCNFSDCHPDNGDWFTYSIAKNNAAIIKTRTGNGSMPKDDGVGKGGDLSADQIKLIACWVDGGAPEN